jgi:orotidine-5'-phosphate decarboxylase
MMMAVRDRLIVALDTADLDEALGWAVSLRGAVTWFKVGLALFTRVGPDGIRRIRGEGARLFLDLKFHDIPAVVAEAAAGAVEMGADMFTVHAQGGRAMMEAAARGAHEAAARLGRPSPIVLGVTILTSLDRDDLTAIGAPGEPSERVVTLARLARASGLGGLVCSAREAALARPVVGADFVIVTPGIRPSGGERGDQKRVVPPGEAIRGGADYLVVGRPITGASDPVGAARGVLAEMSAAAGGAQPDGTRP